MGCFPWSLKAWLCVCHRMSTGRGAWAVGGPQTPPQPTWASEATLCEVVPPLPYPPPTTPGKLCTHKCFGFEKDLPMFCCPCTWNAFCSSCPTLSHSPGPCGCRWLQSWLPVPAHAHFLGAGVPQPAKGPALSCYNARPPPQLCLAVEPIPLHKWPAPGSPCWPGWSRRPWNDPLAPKLLCLACVFWLGRDPAPGAGSAGPLLA